MRFSFHLPSAELVRNYNDSLKSVLLFAYTILIVVREGLQAIDEDAAIDPSRLALDAVLVDVCKLLAAIALFLLSRQLGAIPWSKPNLNGSMEEGQPLNSLNSGSDEELQQYPNGDENRRARRSPSPAPALLPISGSLIFTILAAALTSCSRYFSISIRTRLDPFTLYLGLSLSSVITALYSRVFLRRDVEAKHWQAVLLQFSGMLAIQSSFVAYLNHTDSTYPSILGLALATSFPLVLLDLVYTTHHRISIPTVHILLFACTLVLDLISLAAQHRVPDVIKAHTSAFAVSDVLEILAQATSELLLLAIVYCHNALTASIVTPFGIVILLLTIGVFSATYTVAFTAGCLLSLFGACYYLTTRARTPDNLQKPGNLLLTILASVILVISIVYVAVNFHRPSNAENTPRFKPKSIVDLINAEQAGCVRKALLSDSFYPYERKYHAFDNILLIVFFSHARYNVNLDYYKEVYSEFFPNIVFVGPGSREDAGFSHSYDVLVDSYEADEDLSDPSFYKMAGRMAHHMLYTAMREYDCYDGYLWAPFDTLLNIPRLQQFDQQHFWYHSPFGEYVHNPALGDEAANKNASRHPPPLNISPDPAINLTETWRGWGQDWWWGEPHVGLEVCMRAFNKVPLDMRERLAVKTNGTRLIGGSADTLYIPGQHRDSFMEILGLFLETDCFLEIATPTAVHLVVPPDEPILYVDHWWIWQPPFNASFVRQKWEEGFEVDTFHTFHWGEKGADGVWRGNPANIPDVRRLLLESAKRQGSELPIRDVDHMPS